MPTRFTVSIPDDAMVTLTQQATAQLRTPKAQAEWMLVQQLRQQQQQPRAAEESTIP